MARSIRLRGVLSPDGPADGQRERGTWRPTEPLTPPRSTVEAVRAMQVGAVLSLLEVVRAVLTRGQLRAAFDAEAHSQNRSLNAHDLDAVVTVGLSVSVVVGMLGALVWWWQSRVTARGSKWGRIASCVLLAAALVGFFGGLIPTAGPFARMSAMLLLAAGVFAVVRLWHRDSSAWISYQSTPQD
ncbi:hypothetical protein [Knoellia koreensis]|uniref:Uncharacterized protein n=1 Tax=Knoellia koreensis TaxID=2730921 RepID=A0A849HLF9_9MICO|nr:hypothetical protein [Knoellia sp. DB2414S]NNM47211.1 hypothetical protein [Knoellia sp. DB2414S]